MDQQSVDPHQADIGPEAKAAVAAAELPGNYFELYKLAVEMADRMSARRGIANSFFLTVNTGVMAVLGTQDVRWYLATAGILLCAAWWILLKSYRDLNGAKFEIILAMEQRLPIRIYGEEWDRLLKEPVRFAVRREVLGPWLAQYRELGYAERIVPWLFILIYIAEIIQQAIK